jgi:hypothetical protein
MSTAVAIRRAIEERFVLRELAQVPTTAVDAKGPGWFCSVGPAGTSAFRTPVSLTGLLMKGAAASRHAPNLAISVNGPLASDNPHDSRLDWKDESKYKNVASPTRPSSIGAKTAMADPAAPEPTSPATK